MPEVTPTLGLNAAFRTDPGRVRTNNEDVALVDTDRGVFGVIDGVGGHAAGELAAAIAGDVILQRLARPLGAPAERVREAIAIANNEIFRRASESPELHGMTCVVTLAVVSERGLTIGHVGDGRLYKIRPDGVHKLTHDHSPVGEREDAQELTEAEAMRHPRRNEVFRDVGSAQRDKDEEDYVDVIEEPMERDTAILLCTDGLTDMVTSATIARIVREHAGSPESVVAALIKAANDAGGRDNVTVVYVEAPEFARTIRRKWANGVPAARPVRAPKAAADGIAAETRDLPAPPRRGNGVVRFGSWVWRSRTTWFALGALAGIGATLGLIWYAPPPNPPANRTLIVGGSNGIGFARIADAVRAARAGDVIRLEPGVYREHVLLPPGVSLEGRIPSTATIARDPARTDGGIAITASGDLSSRISGIRIESTPELPIEVGIRVSGQDHSVDLVEIAGPMRAGVELLPGAAATLHGNHLSVQGTALSFAEHSFAVVSANVFLRQGRFAEPAVAIADSAQITLKRNVFSGYGNDAVRGVSASERKQIVSDNVVITNDPVAR